MADIPTCSAPGCSEPGTKLCSSCKITLYCSVACQTKDWDHHKEACQGRLRKLGKDYVEKADRFDAQRNFAQALRYSALALSMLKKLNPRTIEVIKLLDTAMRIKFNALSFTNRKMEALECAKDRYSLWSMGYMRHSGMLLAAFPLIEGLIHNKEYEQAALIARTAYDMIINDTDNIIPEDERQQFLAHGSRCLAQATFRLSESGGIPPEGKQKAGEEAIALAYKALEIETQLYGTESEAVAIAMGSLANILMYFNGVDDDECFRLYEQSIAIYSRIQGSISLNVATGKYNLSVVYERRALGSNDLDRCLTDLEKALTHSIEAVRIYRAINHVDKADECARQTANVEKNLIQLRLARN